MDLLQFFMVLIAIGVLLWLVNKFIPMDPQIKNVLGIVVLVAVVLWVMSLFGLFSALHAVRVGRP